LAKEIAVRTVNMLDAKTNLSRLVEAVESGDETEILIARNGKPVARLTAVKRDVSKRIGVAEGEFEVPDDIDRYNDEIEALFDGEQA
jgi:prevent-host-death family protein